MGIADEKEMTTHVKRRLCSIKEARDRRMYIFRIEFSLPPSSIPEILTHLSAIMTNSKLCTAPNHLCLLHNSHN